MNLLNEKLQSLNATEGRLRRSIKCAQKRLKKVQEEKKKVLREIGDEFDE
jgi:uncharacterized protein YlxW (UPF0749 family)